jgi:ATP diphosphatase
MDSADAASIKDEFGDVLFALVNFGRHLKIDAEAALSGTNEKFRDRFHKVERALGDTGSSLEEATLDEMEALWQQAKRTK